MPPGHLRPERAASLAFAFFAVHPARKLRRISRRTGYAVAVTEPLEQVAVLASAAAERSVLRVRRLAAQRAELGFRLARHTRRTWVAWRPPAS